MVGGECVLSAKHNLAVVKSLFSRDYSMASPSVTNGVNFGCYNTIYMQIAFKKLQHITIKTQLQPAVIPIRFTQTVLNRKAKIPRLIQTRTKSRST